MDDYVRRKVDEIARHKQRGELPAALTAVDELLAERPDLPSAHGHRAHVLHLMKQTAKGLQWLSDHRPAAGYPDYIEALEAELLWAAKRKDEARVVVDGLLPKAGLGDAAVKRLVEVLEKMHERPRARQLVERWLPSSSDRKAGSLLLARLQDNPGPTLRQLLADYPDDDKLWEQATRMRLEALTAEEALSELQVIVATSRGAASADLRRMLGTALRHAGRHDEALAEFDKCLEADPHSAFYRSQRSFCLADLGRYDEALDGFEEAMAARPHDVILRRNLYVNYKRAQAFDRAAHFTESMVARRPDLAGQFWASLKSVKK